MSAEPRAAGQATPLQALRLSLAAEPAAVRQGLADLMAGLSGMGVAEDLRDTAELVMAEVLNNVVEHAYARRPGRIDVVVNRVAQGLCCCVTDAGLPMPGGEPPPGHLPEGSGDDLPEGGFGWFLIRELSRDLRYARRAGHNVLSFRLPSLPSAAQSET